MTSQYQCAYGEQADKRTEKLGIDLLYGGGSSRKKKTTDASRLTAASPFQLHLLHVDLTGGHPNGDGVDDGRVLKDGRHVVNDDSRR